MTTKRSKNGSEKDKSIPASLESENNNKQKPARKSKTTSEGLKLPTEFEKKTPNRSFRFEESCCGKAREGCKTKKQKNRRK